MDDASDTFAPLTQAELAASRTSRPVRSRNPRARGASDLPAGRRRTGRDKRRRGFTGASRTHLALHDAGR